MKSICLLINACSLAFGLFLSPMTVLCQCTSNPTKKPKQICWSIITVSKTCGRGHLSISSLLLLKISILFRSVPIVNLIVILPMLSSDLSSKICLTPSLEWLRKTGFCCILFCSVIWNFDKTSCVWWMKRSSGSVCVSAGEISFV